MRDRAAREAEVARQREDRQSKIRGQVELILADVDGLMKEQKWEAVLAVAKRAETAVTGAEADAVTTRRVRALLKDLEFIGRLDDIRMQNATLIRETFHYAVGDREYARVFREYGVNVNALTVETSIDRLTARPVLAIPLGAALDQWAAQRWASKGDGADWKRLVAISRAIDPEPLRDRLRSFKEQPVTPQMHDELRRLAESIDIGAHRPATLLGLAQSLRQFNELDSSAQLLRDANTSYAEDFWLNYSLAYRLAERKDYEGAVRFYTAAVSIRPNAVAARHNLGGALRDQRKLDEAIACFRKAIEIDPSFALSYFGLGDALHKQGKLDDAIDGYLKAIAIDPKYAGAYSNMGVVLRDQKKLDKAVAAFKKAIELDPKYATAYLNLGALLCDNLNDHDKAIVCFRRAIELDPENTDAHYNLGVALSKQGKLDEAIAEFRDVIERTPDHAAAHYHLAAALQRLGKMDQAIVAFERVIELEPNNALHMNEWAWLLATCSDTNYRDPKRAVELARRAVELMPQAGGFWNTLGVAHYRAGAGKDAIAALEKSMELRGGDGDDWFFLAMAHWNLGDKDKARLWYDKAVAWAEDKYRFNPTLLAFRVEAGELFGAEDAAFHVARARMHSSHSRWDEAAADFAATAEALPPGDPWFENACLLLLTGDADGYRRFCESMAAQTGSADDPFVAFQLAHACAVGPDPPVPPERMVQWAERAVGGDPKAPAWYLHVLGLASPGPANSTRRSSGSNSHKAAAGGTG